MSKIVRRLWSDPICGSLRKKLVPPARPRKIIARAGL